MRPHLFAVGLVVTIACFDSNLARAAGNSAVAAPLGGESPSIYVSIVSHNEEPPGYPDFTTNETAFWVHREAVRVFAESLSAVGVEYNFQSEWNYLEATLTYDAAGTALTNWKPLPKYLVEDLLFEVDPHAHETSRTYADVASLDFDIVGSVSGVAGGFIAGPPDESIVDRLRDPVACSVYAGPEWQAEILWGAATPGHVDESALWISGIWRPRDDARFLEHDPCGSLVCVGGFTKTWEGLDTLLARRTAGLLDPNKMYTATIFLQQVELLMPGFIEDFVARIRALEPETTAGVIQWVGLSDAVTIWETSYDAVPTIYPYEGIALEDTFYTPCSIQDVDLLASGRLLVTDSGDEATAERGGVYEIDRNGRVFWSFRGAVYPESAERLPNGNTLIADTGNDRVVIVDPDAAIAWNTSGIALSDGSTLSGPCDARAVPPSGRTLITDRDNHRVLEIGPGGTVFWQFGQTGIPGAGGTRTSSPSSAERLTTGETLIADTGNDRVLEVSAGLVVQWVGTGFDAPTDADRLSTGCTLVTDVGSRRIVERDATATCDWEFARELRDPREADRLADGHALIADDERILETDGDTTVIWCYTGPSNYQEVLIENPTSGVTLYCHVHRPRGFDAAGSYPGVVLIPGGSQSGISWEMDGEAQSLANAGAIVVHFDPDGRGLSTDGGTYFTENYNGYLNQDGLHAVFEWLVALPETDDALCGLFSKSYGITMAAGMLARYEAAPPCAFLIDWEGPHNRSLTSSTFGGHVPYLPSEDSLWVEREAETFMPSIVTMYQRIQSAVDHNPNALNNAHAIALTNAATHTSYGGTGRCWWTRVNHGDLNDPNETYTLAAPPGTIVEADDDLAYWVARFLEMLASPATGVEPSAGSSAGATLSHGGPNPFRRTTTLRLTLDGPRHVNVGIYDVAGALVRRLVDSALPPGRHEVEWNGRDGRGIELPSGVYFARVAHDSRAPLKFVLVR